MYVFPRNVENNPNNEHSPLTIFHLQLRLYPLSATVMLISFYCRYFLIEQR